MREHRKERETEHESAIGGMRTPKSSARRLPETLRVGAAFGKLLG